MRTLPTLAVLALLASPGCSRTPPEPSPATTATTAAAVVAPASPPSPASTPSAPPVDPSRCVTKLAAKAPPIPPAASPSACPRDPEPSLKLPTAEVTLTDAPGGPRVKVELATSEDQIRKGLMYRREMPEEAGMLFKLDGRKDHTFWMHNTCIPLDMMFVDEDGLIVGIVEAAEPITDDTRSVGCPSRYVLEVNAGYTRRHGVAPGQRLALPAALR